MEKGQISSWQFFLMIFGFLLGNSLFFYPGGLIEIAKQDAWIVPLWAGAAGVILSLIWIKLASYYPGLTLVQICTKAAGKGIGGLIALLYVGYFVHLATFVTRDIGDFMKNTLMPRTPISVFHIMFLIVICFAVIKGAEAIARTTEFLFPLAFLIYVIVFFIALPNWNWDRLQGMFRMNVWTTIKETKYVFSFPYMEAIVFMMLYPYVQNKIKRSYIMGIVVATLSLSATVLFTIGLLGVTRASHETYSLFVIAQEIHFGTFFEHLESTFALFLLVAIFVKLAIAYYAAVLGLCQLFGVNDRSWLAISLILLISGLALEFDNVLDKITFKTHYYFEYMLLFAIIFPVLLLFITWLKQSKGNQKAG